MAQLELPDAMNRLQANEERMDTFVNGNEDSSYTTTAGESVPSIQNFLKDQEQKVDTLSAGFASDGGTTLVGGTWFGGLKAKVAALGTALGSSLIGFIQAGSGAVGRSLMVKAGETVSVYDYLTPQLALDSGAKRVRFPAGKYVFDGSTAQALNVNTYNYGDTTLKACLIVPYGVIIETDGYETEFHFTNLGADVCGIAIAEHTSGMFATHSQATHTMQALTLRAIGGPGRYGIVTPKKAGLFSNKRPKYIIEGVHFCGANDSKTIFGTPAEGWDIGINVGDSVGNEIFFTGYGTYNTTAADAGQHQMIGCRVSGAVGAYGTAVRFIASNMRTFVDMGDGTEGFYVHGFEGQGCWEGVTTSNAGGEPGGFIMGGHINANSAGYVLKNRTEFQMIGASAYRSDAYHDHGGEWSGLKLTDCQSTKITSLTTAHGGIISRTNSAGVRALRSSVEIVSLDMRAMAYGLILDDCDDVTVRAVSVNAVATLYDIRNTTTDVNVDMPTIKGTHATLLNFVVADGTIDKTRLYFPRETPQPVLRYSSVLPDAAGTTTIKPRLSPAEWQFAPQAGAGVYTYDVLLDGPSAVAGDEIIIKIIGTASVNPTLRILNRSTASVLSTFTSTAAGKRFVGRYVFDGVNWLERGLYESVEASY